MRTLLKIIRWIVIILATMSVIGFILRLLTSGTQQSGGDIAAIVVWVVVGGVALYFELKKREGQ